MTYVELRAHSCFSFSDGAVSAENLARRARELGYTHLGITDTADLGGKRICAVGWTTVMNAERRIRKDLAERQTVYKTVNELTMRIKQQAKQG